MTADQNKNAVLDRAFWRDFWRRAWMGFALVFGVIALWIGMLPANERQSVFNYFRQIDIPVPAPSLAPLLVTPPSVQVHVAAAVIAVVAGALIFLLPKGTGFHRLLGWTWVSSMIVVVATSVAMIADLKTGVNVLHIFTAVTVVSLWAGLTRIRRGDVRGHASAMAGLYVGGLIIAGVFAFIPGRTMWQVLFGG